VNAADVLRSLSLFAGLPDDEVSNVAALAEPFSVEAGETLFEEGDPASTVFVVATGRVQSRKRLPGDRSVTATELGPGTMFGEMAIIAGLPRLVGATAVERTTGLAIDARAARGLAAAPRVGSRELGRRLGLEAVATLRGLVERLALSVDADPRATQAPPSGGGPPPPVVEVEPEPGETDYLQTLLFLSDFDAPELERLFGGLRRLSAPRGATLVEEGDRPEALLIVTRGAVESTVRRGGAAGRVRLSGPGRVVTHLGILDEDPSPVTCRARERSELLEVTRSRLRELMDADGLVPQRFFWGLYRDVVDAILHADRPLSRMAAARP
jgi:CRP-like cAMP-binding protein